MPPGGRSWQDLESPADPKRPISVAHNLTDDDLRRLPDFDFWYDPMPLLGFLPQWLWFVGLMAVGGYFVGLSKFGSTRAGVILSPIFAVGCTWGMVAKMAGNRQAARQAGLCTNRVLTIGPSGLRLATPNGSPIGVTSANPAVHPWGAFRKIELIDGHILFWLKGRRRVIVPRGAFADPSAEREFLRAARWWHAVASDPGFAPGAS